MILIIDLFALLTPYIFHPLTRSLVCCCRNWSSDIKYSSDFGINSLHLHSRISILLINLQLPWAYAVAFDLFVFLTPDILPPPTRSRVFCCRLYYSDINYSSDFRKTSLHLHSTIDKPLINIILTLYPDIDCLLIITVDPRYIAPTNPVPGIMLFSLVFSYQIFPLIFKNIPYTCTQQ